MCRGTFFLFHKFLLGKKVQVGKDQEKAQSKKKKKKIPTPKTEVGKNEQLTLFLDDLGVQKCAHAQSKSFPICII